MLTGTTSTGFAWEIEEDALDDAELIDALIEFDKGGMEAVPTACRRLLGKDQHAALYEHLRGEDGRVRFSDVALAFGEILNSLQDGKKS